MSATSSPAFDVWEVITSLRDSFTSRPPGRMGRGDIRTAILVALTEEPMHGYQIIREIEDRSGGSWKPSAGSVYPTLQLLADEGLIVASEDNGRKTYSLTEAGREIADEEADSAPWGADASADRSSGGSGGGAEQGFGALPRAGVEFAQAAAQVHRSGSPEQIQQAITVVDEARKRLYAILAQD